MKIANKISQLIGNTPLLRLNRLGKEYGADILVKLESNNPSFSVKDRLALALIEDAEKKRLIGLETVIIEPTSGNTGIGLAMICAERGYKLIITMPESASIERRSIIKAFGAEIVLTSAESGMKGAIARAHELKDFYGNAFIPYQFINKANPQMHRLTTGPEIWNDTEGSVDIFVAGVGTGGTITGVAEMLKSKKPSIKAYAVEPADSPVISGGLPGKHKIQGIGAGFLPDILNKDILDGVITVATEDAMLIARRLMQEEGILCGISSGANVWSAIQLASKPENKGKTIVTIICDTGERYLSTDLFKID
ncbi:MAG: cysteine synthase A [Lentimicrobiaceae bacterium]|nr:cysteine synthase A [Lentimicrobiaceae bacterium]